MLVVVCCILFFVVSTADECQPSSHAVSLLADLAEEEFSSLAQFEVSAQISYSSLMGLIDTNENGYFVRLHAAFSSTGNYVSVQSCRNVYGETDECKRSSANYILWLLNVRICQKMSGISTPF